MLYLQLGNMELTLTRMFLLGSSCAFPQCHRGRWIVGLVTDEKEVREVEELIIFFFLHEASNQ
jgi:hypothetical protein